MSATPRHTPSPKAGRFADRCEQIIGGLQIPRPFDETLFLENLGEQHGKPIALLVAPPRTGLPSGLLFVTPTVDIIIRVDSTSSVHAHHITAHEVAHLLLKHKPIAHTNNETDDLLVSTLATLFPDVTPALIRRMLRRQSYEDDEEREAETFASMLILRAYGPTMAAVRPEHHVLEGIEASITRIENALRPLSLEEDACE